MCTSTLTNKLQKGQETLHPIPVSHQVWNQICIGVIDPLKQSAGYRYIVTALDYTSKFVEAKPLKEKTGKAVAKFLYKLLCQYGFSDIHVTDLGREMINTITKEFYHLADTYHCRTSYYHPQDIGLVEQPSKTVENCI